MDVFSSDSLTAEGFVTVMIIVLTNLLKNIKGISAVPTQAIAILFGPVLLAVYLWSMDGNLTRSVVVNGVFLGLSAIGAWHVATGARTQLGGLTTKNEE